MSSKAELLRLLEPPAEKWLLPSPEEIVRSYGSALPADYIWLAETYGPVEISRYFGIFPPVVASEIGTRPGVFPTSADVSDFADENAGFDPAYVEPDGLLMWGITQNDDCAFWLPVGDPDTWPVVISRSFRRTNSTWVRYDIGVVEFLVRTIHGRLPGNPFSSDELWLIKSPTFERY